MLGEAAETVASAAGSVPKPSGGFDPVAAKNAANVVNSTWFQLKVDTWARVSGSGPVDWDAVRAAVQTAEFQQYGSVGEAVQSMGMAYRAGQLPNGAVQYGIAVAGSGVPLWGKSVTAHELLHIIQDMQNGAIAMNDAGTLGRLGGLGQGPPRSSAGRSPPERRSRLSCLPWTTWADEGTRCSGPPPTSRWEPGTRQREPQCPPPHLALNYSAARHPVVRSESANARRK